MQRSLRLRLAPWLSALVVAGCGGSDAGDSAAAGSQPPPLIETSAESAGENCEFGGTKLNVGLDDGSGDGTADNGVLEPGEIRGESFVCGPKPSDTPSASWPTLISVSTEPAGDECEHGGQRIDTGLDDGAPGGTADNGVLEPEEVTNSAYACQQPVPTGDDSAQVVDSEGTVLGTVVRWDSLGVTIKSATGYYYDLSWNGSFDSVHTSIPAFFAEDDCTGAIWMDAIWDTSASYRTEEDQLLRGDELFYVAASGQHYVAKQVVDGFAARETFTPLSKWSHIQRTCGAPGTPFPGPEFSGWELEPIEPEVAGIPENIVGPLYLD